MPPKDMNEAAAQLRELADLASDLILVGALKFHDVGSYGRSWTYARRLTD